MKGGKIELKKAHETKNGVPSHCSLVWDSNAEHIVTCGPDSTIVIHPYPQSSSLSSQVTTLRHHKAEVTSVALSPDSTCLASGSVDHSVKLFSFPGGEFQSNVTRFSLPIRCLTFNKSGSLLAAAGDDEGIKLIATIDGSITRILKGHKGPITSVSFDPKDEYLASIDGFGTVIFWELCSGKIVNTLKNVAPNNGLEMAILNGLSWRPDGEMLAVPGLKNEVVMYDRDTAEKLFSLKGGHLEQVSFVAWSPNGNYLATSGLDKQVLVWDVEQKQDIDRRKFETRVCSVAWKPKENGLAIIDALGKFGVWESAVPSHMRSPVEGAPVVRSSINGLFAFEEEEEKVDDNSGSIDHIGDGIGNNNVDEGDIELKRLRKKVLDDDEFDEDNNNHVNVTKYGSKLKMESISRRRREGSQEFDSARKAPRSKAAVQMQASFQSGSTPFQEGKRRFLCYSMLGCITSFKNEESSHIEVDFHDTSQGFRVPAMTDYFGFTMGSLNEKGCVFANPHRGEKNSSTLMYRPFCSWANNSEWSMRFDSDEEVKNVALGNGWVAAITSLNFLRIYTEGGLQNYILSLDGPVITSAGSGDELAVVTHVSDCLASGTQVLEVRLFNITSKSLIMRAPLPLTPGSYLEWLGFSEEGFLSSYDSKGVLRVFVKQYAESWIPLFSAMKERKHEKEKYWVVGLNSTTVFCIVCNEPDIYPSVNPKPILTPCKLGFPLALSDLGADDLEKEMMMNNLYLSRAEKKLDEMIAAGLDTMPLEDEIFNKETLLDRCILRLIASCCKGDKLVRATELAKQLSLEKSLTGAIKLVTAMKLPLLAEKFSSILEERMLKESTAAQKVVSHSLEDVSAHSVEPLKNNNSLGKAPEAVPTNIRVAHPLADSFKISPTSVIVSRKAKLDLEPGKTCNVPDRIEKSKVIGNESEVKSTSTLDQNQNIRRSNPFAKAATVQERTSLIDSIKQMKKVEPETTKKLDGNKRKESASSTRESERPKKSGK